MKKALLIFTCLLLITNIAFAQNEGEKKTAKLVTTEKEFDFGTIKEADGPVSHTFIIKNEGTSPLVITRATASCGCTTPSFSPEPVAPGKTTELKVTYNPAGRPGQFVKTVAIYSNGSDGAVIVRLKGIVE